MNEINRGYKLIACIRNKRLEGGKRYEVNKMIMIMYRYEIYTIYIIYQNNCKNRK